MTMHLIKKCTINWEKIFAAEANRQNPTAPPKYSAEFLLEEDGAELAALRRTYLEVWQHGGASWKKKEAAQSKSDRAFFKSLYDVEEEKTHIYEGRVRITASAPAEYPPVIVGRDRAPIPKGAIYNGCIVAAQIDVYYSQRFESVFSGLKAVQFIAQGTRLAGAFAVPNVSAFEKFEEEDEEEENGSPF